MRREGAGPQRGYTRPGTGSLHPVAIRAAVEATRLLKPLVQRVAKATRRAFGWRIVISQSAGHVTLSHSVAGLARLELVVADFKGVRAGRL